MSLNVYKSSAGSGKTFTIVKEYLKIILKNPNDFRHILAITFTNKAAREMKERILQNLIQIAESDTESAAWKFLLPEIEKETNINRNILIKRSEESITLLLHNYSEFAISTIDSFMHRLIRQFAFDLNLSANFNVMIDTDDFLMKTVHLLLSKAGSNKILTDFLVDYIDTRTDEDKDWHIENEIFSVSKELLKERTYQIVELLENISLEDFNKTKAESYKFIYFVEKQITEEAQKAIELIKSQGLSEGDFLQTSKSIHKYFSKIESGNIEMRSLQGNSYVLGAINDDKWYGAKCNNQVGIDNIKGKLVTYYNNINILQKKYSEEYFECAFFCKNFHAIALLNEMKKLIKELNKEDEFLMISEFNSRIASIVLNESVPYIYERLGEKYNNLFIDEFQDTSTLQWHNFLPLIDESLAKGNNNILVGDVKQSIYRFRNSNVEQFALLPEIQDKDLNLYAHEREVALKHHFQQTHLNTNYRSLKEIVNFNNDFFKVISEYDQYLNTYYKDCFQHSSNKDNEGHISMEFLPKEDEDVFCIRTLQIIEESIELGYNYNDIAILCFRNSEASEIATFLVENGIDVISEESLLLKNSDLVCFLVDNLRFLSNNDSELAIASILNFITSKKILGELNFAQSLQRVFYNYKSENSLPPRILFLNLLKEYNIQYSKQELLSLPLYDAVEFLIRLFKLEDSVNNHVLFFLNAIHSFGIKENNNISRFIDWWEENNKKLSVKIPDGKNAVRIHTIHKAKGLEFPIVIIPFAKKKINIKSSSEWVKTNNIKNPPYLFLSINKELQNTQYSEVYDIEYRKSILDLINMLYVGFTRAEQMLFILSEIDSNGLKIKGNKDGNPYNTISNVQNLLINYLQQKELINDTKLTYTFGKKLFYKNRKPDDKTNMIKFDSFVSTDWRKQLHLKLKHNIILFDIHSTEWGKRVHEILSRWEDFKNTEEIISYIENTLKCSEDEVLKLKQYISDITSHNLLKTYFAKGIKVLCEREIITPEGKVYRPDRIVFEEKQTTIIDFKTGKANPKDLEQLKDYALLLKNMRYSNIKAFILYLHDDAEVVEIDI